MEVSISRHATSAVALLASARRQEETRRRGSVFIVASFELLAAMAPTLRQAIAVARRG
jgi:hypothetical protein